MQDVGKLGVELHHPLKIDFKYWAMDSAWIFLVKYVEIG